MTKIINKVHTSKQDIHFTYRFKSREKNPDWSFEKLTSLRSCHIHNKASRSLEDLVLISTIPKWLTTLEKEELNTETGELIYFDYETDDFKASRNRKIKTVEKFCDFYEPLYRKKEISVLFHTFTRSDYSKKDMKTMVECAKRRYGVLKRQIRGYLWVLELKRNEKMQSGFHIHYHLVVATDRLNVKKIPDQLKFEDLWGQRTGVEFIKKSVRGYLSKYLYKSDGKILYRRIDPLTGKFTLLRSQRSYAISRKLI